MKPSPAFLLVIRVIGIAGLCAGLFMIFVAFVFLITKSPEVHISSLIIGVAISVVSVYLILGAPNIVTLIKKKLEHESDDA